MDRVLKGAEEKIEALDRKYLGALKKAGNAKDKALKDKAEIEQVMSEKKQLLDESNERYSDDFKQKHGVEKELKEQMKAMSEIEAQLRQEIDALKEENERLGTEPETVRDAGEADPKIEEIEKNFEFLETELAREKEEHSKLKSKLESLLKGVVN